MPDKPDTKYNWSLIIGLSIPVLMTLFITVAIHGPRWFNAVGAPEHDFLYVSGQQNPYQAFRIVDGKLTWEFVNEPKGHRRDYSNYFFVHDVSENASHEVTLEEIELMSLDGTYRSPDGFSVDTGHHGGWFIFSYGHSHRRHFLVKDRYSLKLRLETPTQRYNYYNFRFLGWIAHEQ